MKRLLTLLVAMVVVGLTGVRLAAGDNDLAAQIAPFVNEQTIAVVHFDAADVNLDAVEQWVNQVVAQSKLDDSDRRAMSETLHRQIQEFAPWLSDFKKAGGKSIWFVFTLEDFPSSPPLFMVVPIENGTDPAALKKLFGGVGPGGHSYGFKSEPIAQVNDALVIGPGGNGAAPYAKIQPQARPELSKALATAGAGKLQIAMIPSEGARKVVETMAPSLPGGQPATTLSRGVLWGGAAVQWPPDVTVRLLVQSQDADSANALLSLIQSFAAEARKQIGGDFTKVSLLRTAAALADRAGVQGDKLIIDLNKSAATEVAVQIGNSLRGMREQSYRIESQSNIKQLLLGVIMWANNKTKEGAPFPDNFDQVMKDEDMSLQVLINPRHPEMPVGYVYIRPPEGETAPADRLVIYEKFTAFGQGVAAGFADGHSEWIADEKSFKKLLEEALRIQKAAAQSKAAPNPK